MLYNTKGIIIRKKLTLFKAKKTKENKKGIN